MSEWQLQMPGGALSGNPTAPGGLSLTEGLTPLSAPTAPSNPTDPTTYPIVPPLQAPPMLDPAGGTPAAAQPAEDTESEDNGGEPLTGQTVSGEQASPPLSNPPAAADAPPAADTPPAPPAVASTVPSAITDWRDALRLLGISYTEIDAAGGLDKYLEEKGLDQDDLEDGISWEEARQLGSNMTQAYYDILSTGGRRIDGDGKVEMDDIRRFNEKVIQKLSAGTGKPEEILAKYLHTGKFKMIDSRRAVALFSEKFGANTSLFSGESINVKTLVGSYARTELQDLACVVLTNILRPEQAIITGSINETLTLTKEQLETFFVTMYFLGKVDDPTEILQSAQGRPKLEGDTPEHFLAWLTHGTSNAVPPPAAEEASSTSGAEGAQAAGDWPADWPADLREGLKLIALKDAQGNISYKPNVSLENWKKAQELFAGVLSGSAEERYKILAADSWVRCVEALARAARTGTDLAGVITSAEGALTAVSTALGASKVIELRQLWMSLAQHLNDEDLAFAQIQPLEVLYNDPNNGLTAVTIPGELARLAMSCASLQNIEHRNYALTLAEKIKVMAPQSFIIQGPAAAEGEQPTSQSIETEDFIAQIKQTVNDHPLLRKAKQEMQELFARAQGNPAQNIPPQAPTAAQINAVAEAYQKAIAALVGDADPISVGDLAEARIWKAYMQMMAAELTAASTDGNQKAKLTAQANALLAVFPEVLGLDPAGDFSATGEGSLIAAIRAVDEQLEKTDLTAEERTRLEDLRRTGVQVLLGMAQVFIFAKAKVSQPLKGQCIAAYKAIAQLMKGVLVDELGLGSLAFGDRNLNQLIPLIRSGGSMPSGAGLQNLFNSVFGGGQPASGGSSGGSGGGHAASGSAGGGAVETI